MWGCLSSVPLAAGLRLGNGTANVAAIEGKNRVNSSEIVIIGSGSLAAKVANSLSQFSAGPLRVAVVGRSKEKVGRIALLGNARGRAVGGRVEFVPYEMARFNAKTFRRMFGALKPKVVFHAASVQSPWEGAQEQNAWTRLIATAGFGVTLPLQLALAVEVCRAAEEHKAAIINASYPDCVNVVLDRLGMRVTCGIGNSAIVEAFCRSSKEGKGKDVRVVGHHGHLGVWLQGKLAVSQPRVWVKGKEIASQRIRPKFGSIGEELNEVTSATAVAIILSLVTGATLEISTPGVGGLPGGYPFVLKNGKFRMRLPGDIRLEEAIAHNRTGERQDGLELGTGVKFVDKAEQVLGTARFEYEQGFDFVEWKAAYEKMLLLRQRLRAIKD